MTGGLKYFLSQIDTKSCLHFKNKIDGIKTVEYLAPSRLRGHCTGLVPRKPLGDQAYDRDQVIKVGRLALHEPHPRAGPSSCSGSCSSSTIFASASAAVAPSTTR